MINLHYLLTSSINAFNRLRVDITDLLRTNKISPRGNSMISMIFLTFLFTNNIFAENNITDMSESRSIILLDSSVTDKYQIDVKVINNEIVIFDGECKKDSNYFYYTLYFPNTSTTRKIILPESIWDKRNWISDLTFNENNLILLTRDYIYYMILRNEEYHLDKSHKLLFPCEYIKYEKRTLSCYFSSSLTSHNTSTNTYKIDVDSNGVNTIRYFPDPEGIKWTRMQPRKLIDIYEDKIAISDADDYRIIIYDQDANPIDSIKRRPENWLVKNQNIDFNNKYALVDGLSASTLIQKIHWLGKDKILVSWTMPVENGNYYEVVFDLWNRINNHWEIAYQDVQKRKNEDEDLFDVESMRIARYYLSGEYLMYIVSLPYILTDRHNKMTNKELKSEIFDYYNDNPSRYSLILNKIK